MLHDGTKDMVPRQLGGTELYKNGAVSQRPYQRPIRTYLQDGEMAQYIK